MTRTFPKWRVRLLTILIAFVVSVLVYRLVQVQILRHEFYSCKAKKQWHKKVSWPARRGSILDRSGLALAVTHRNYSVGITPHHFPDDPKTIKCFSSALGITAGKLRKALRRSSISARICTSPKRKSRRFHRTPVFESTSIMTGCIRSERFRSRSSAAWTAREMEPAASSTSSRIYSRGRTVGCWPTGMRSIRHFIS